MSLKELNTVPDVVEWLGKEAKKNDLFLSEVWIDWAFLCYAMFQNLSDEEVNKQRQKEIEEREGKKIEYLGTLNKRGNRNWKPIMGKINLCKTWIKKYRERAKELRLKEFHEQPWEPTWDWEDIVLEDRYA